MVWISGSSNNLQRDMNGPPATIATEGVGGDAVSPWTNGGAASGGSAVKPAAKHDEDVIIELDQDVIWSWYTLSSSLKNREFSVRELGKSWARMLWALAIHAVSAAMLWAVFINSGTSGLAGGRHLDDPTEFDVYLDTCNGLNMAQLTQFLDGTQQPFWNLNDRLWLRQDAASTIFAVYNADQPNTQKLVSGLCWEAGCMPTSIVAVNGETDAAAMEEIFFSWTAAFCNFTDSGRRADSSGIGSNLQKANENHYGAGGEQSWSQLSVDQQRYWAYLGWTEEAFDASNPLLCANSNCLPQPLTVPVPGSVNGTLPNPAFVLWDDLTENQVFSATSLGWTADMWDLGEDPRTYLKVTCENYVERNAIFGFVQVCAFVVMSLCCVSEYRNFVMAAMFTFGIEKRLVTRWMLLLVALIGYLVVPVFVQCASALVIFEAGTELDVLMDSLALLFILEMNNYFQFAHNPASTTWHMALPAETYVYVDKVRDWFGRVASTLIIAFTIPLGAVFTLWPGALVHPVWIFNPVLAPAAASGFIIGLCIGFLVLVGCLLKFSVRYSAIIEAANNEEANEHIVVPENAELT